jgi:hypothetical protein
MDKAVGKWLPEPTVQERGGIEGEQLEEATGHGCGHQLGEQERQSKRPG